MNDIFSSLKYVCTILTYSENIRKNFENFNALFISVENGKNKRISNRNRQKSLQKYVVQVKGTCNNLRLF